MNNQSLPNNRKDSNITKEASKKTCVYSSNTPPRPKTDKKSSPELSKTPRPGADRANFQTLIQSPQVETDHPTTYKKSSSESFVRGFHKSSKSVPKGTLDVLPLPTYKKATVIKAVNLEPRITSEQSRDEMAHILKFCLNPKGKQYGVCYCGKRLIPKGKGKNEESKAQLFEEIKTGKKFIGGVILDGSVWLCATCASKISFRRCEEIEEMIVKAHEKGMIVYMATFTFSHHRGTRLKTLLEKAAKAKSTFKSGNNYKPIKDDFDIVGTLNSLEITFTLANGWHPHFHELYFCDGEQDLKAFADTLYQSWKAAALKEGLTMNEHGLDMRGTIGKIADYVTKTGHEPQDPNKLWGVAEEITKGQRKLSRSEHGFTSEGMIQHCYYLRNVAEQTEEVVKELHFYEELLREYAAATHGKRKNVCSKNLKKILDVKVKTDAELVIEQTEHAILIATIMAIGWAILVGNDMIHEFKTMPLAEVKAALVELGMPEEEFHLHRREDREEYARITGTELLSDALDIPPEEAEELLEDFVIKKIVVKPDLSEQPTEEEAELLNKLKPYKVVFTLDACDCGCRLERKALGEMSCCNCAPCPLWSNQTMQRIREVAAANS